MHKLLACEHCLVPSRPRDSSNKGRRESRGGEETRRDFPPSHRSLRSRLRHFAQSQPPNRYLRKEKIRKACGGGSCEQAS